MPLQLREIGFHVENHATQWHGFQHEIQFQEIVVAWIQLTQNINPSSTKRVNGRSTRRSNQVLKLSDYYISRYVASTFKCLSK